MEVTPGEARRYRFLEWLDAQGPGQHDAATFYAGVDHAWSTSRDDLHELKDAGVVRAYFAGGGRIDTELTPRGRDCLERFVASRTDKVARAWACRAQAIQWLYDHGATNQSKPVEWTGMANNLAFTYLGSPFAEEEIDTAAAWLQRHALIAGATAWQSAGPISAHLTAAGEACAEQYDCDPRAYLNAVPNGTTAFTVTGGQVQIATGAGAQLTMNNGLVADDLVEAVRGIFDLTRDFAADCDDYTQLQQAAIAELQAGGADDTSVRTFGERAAAIATASGNAALAAVVTLTIDGLITHATRLVIGS